MNLYQKMQQYFHTLRYLKFTQVWGRAFRFIRPRPDLRTAPEIRATLGTWQTPCARRVSMLSPTMFRFLNTENLILSPTDWNSPLIPKLWLYNLHYFDDLNAQNNAARKDWHCGLVTRWVVENSPGEGTGWEPYPLSIRIVNWIKWALAGNIFDDMARKSIAVQVRFLKCRLEHHLLGNHLFANAKALVFAGCYFEGDEAASWINLGMDILEREIPEQILADGGHFERSTMYHSLAFEDMLDLTNLANVYPGTLIDWQPTLSLWPEIIGKMGLWLRAMSHPDGEIAFFNDAAFGIAPPPSALFSYAERLGLSPEESLGREVIRLDPSGYIRIVKGPAVLLIDAAPIGPDYLPSHAHADTLSYELSLFGHRVVVNSGTSCYGLGKDREWERSTGAHSTLEIDGENSSEVWAGFRVARRAYPVDVSIRNDNVAVLINAAHNGYQRLPGRPVHRRQWILHSNSLKVIDSVEGAINQAISRVYFHPNLHIGKFDQLQELSSVIGGKMHLGGHSLTWTAEASLSSIKSSRWHPEFGIDEENHFLEMSDPYGHAVFSLNW